MTLGSKNESQLDSTRAIQQVGRAGALLNKRRIVQAYKLYNNYMHFFYLLLTHSRVRAGWSSNDGINSGISDGVIWKKYTNSECCNYFFSSISDRGVRRFVIRFPNRKFPRENKKKKEKKEKNEGEKARKKKRKIVRKRDDGERSGFLENSSEKEKEGGGGEERSDGFRENRSTIEENTKRGVRNRVKDRNVRTYIARKEKTRAHRSENHLLVSIILPLADAHDRRGRRNFRIPFHVVTLTPRVRQAAEFKSWRGYKCWAQLPYKLIEESLLLRWSERKDKPFDSLLGRDMSSRLTFKLCQVYEKVALSGYRESKRDMYVSQV